VSDRGRLRTDVGAFAVAMVAIVLFAPALHQGFAYDDVPIILGDDRIRSLANLPSMFTGGYWRNAELALYRPLTTLSFAIDWSIARDSAPWFHFTNILLNAAAGVLAYLLAARLFGAGPALAGGLVFVAHPTHVEAVTNVVGRAELISAIFFLGACLHWTRDPRERRGGLLPAALFALALLAKESAIMLPAALILIDAAAGRLKRSDIRRYAANNARAFAGLAAVAILYLAVRLAVLGGITPTRVDPILEVAGSPGQRILTALQAWPVWLRLLVAPATLLSDYGPAILEPVHGLTPAVAVGAVLLLGLVGAGTFALTRDRGVVGLLLLWFPLTILPVSNLVVPIGVLVAERTLYLPSLVVAFAVARLAKSRLFAAGETARLGAAVLAAVLLLFAIRVVTRIPDWKSTDTIMEALVRDRPDSFRGHWHLARMAKGRGDGAAAAAQYDTAMAIWPRRKTLVIEAIAFASERRDLRRGLALATLAVRQWPEDVDTQRMLAGFALDAGDLDTADRAIHDGLRVDPGDDTLLRMEVALDSIRAARGPR
jgi:protein O-mannosyl-transferase